MPFCLLTKNEILKSHTLSFLEDEVIYDVPYPREYVSSVIEYLKTQEQSELIETAGKKR